MGLFDFLRGKDQKAIPEPGTPEFEAAVQGSALPDDQSVEMGESGWTSAKPEPPRAKADVEEPGQTVEVGAGEAREKVLQALRRHGIDPDQTQTIDANGVPGLRDAIVGALGEAGVQIPGVAGIGGGVSPPPQDPLAVVEELANQRDAGEITRAEFEAHKRRLLGDC